MKILIHSVAPWVPTGYGRQCKQLAQRLKAAGHQVAISAFSGLSGAPIVWEGIPILPGGQLAFGTDVIADHARNHGADLLITLMDFWKLEPVADQLRNIRTLAWLPVDCDPLGAPDRAALLRSGAQPVAMSTFGAGVLRDAGFAPDYAPHGIDTKVFMGPPDRTALRRELGLDEHFLIGICAANTDALRKAWPEQFEAFRIFAETRPEARLMVHTVARSRNGFPLDQLAYDIGIRDKVLFSDQYAQVAGLMGDEVMADWFGALDLLSACSYAEGFCLPAVEAQACGTPVVSHHASALTETARGPWRVTGDPYWNPVHRSWWRRPKVGMIARMYELAYTTARTDPDEWSHQRELSERRALDFDADAVFKRFWVPILERIEEEMSRGSVAQSDLEETGPQGADG